MLTLLTLAWWPQSYLETITVGIDAYQYHAPLFGDHTQSQIIHSSQPLEAIGALLVPLRHSATTPDVVVTLTDTATNTTLQSQTISGTAIADDTFAYLHLNPPLTSRTPVEVTLSAPTASANTALGIRFHPDDVYPAGQRLFDNQPVNGDLALALQKRLPLWHVLIKTAQHNANTTRIITQALLVAVMAAIVASQAGWIRQAPPVRRRLELGILAILALATMFSRLPALSYLGGVSGGDPYNYLFISDSLSQLHNPFERTKRLPGYPLLLLPVYLTKLDDHLWMRLINVISAGGIVFFTGLLARRLGLPWSIQFFAAALLAFQKDFYWLSLRPEAYTVYALLLVASLVLFFSLITWRRRMLFGLVLGYAAMTRQEGFVLAAVLGLAAALQALSTKKLVRHYAAAFLPALLLVAPFFINNTLAYGNPLYTPYFAGERLTIVDSWPAFLDAAGATWGIIGSLWKNSWDHLERLPLRSPWLIGGAIGCLAWWAYHRWRLPRQAHIESTFTLALSAMIVLVSSIIYAKTTTAFATVFTTISAGMLLVSPVAAIGSLRWRGVLLAVVTITQILIATWFHPFPKHYQQDLPLLTLALAILLITPLLPTLPLRRWASGATYLMVAFAFALATLPLYESSRWYKQLDEENQNNALDSVIYRAVTAATNLPGPYGIDHAHLPARLYLQEQSHYYENRENSSPAAEAEWLARNNIQTLIVTNLYPVFIHLPVGWEQVATFKSEGKNEQLIESYVYTQQLD